jgi:DNA-directed RNA polymerase subunit M/transcription elongation factor TFIIS
LHRDWLLAYSKALAADDELRTQELHAEVRRIMANGIRITCPNCQQQMTVPEAVRGKKVRCKKCEGVVPVPAAQKPDDRITTSRVQEQSAKWTEDDDDRKPFVVTETSLAPRCPHCAYEIDPPESLICLHCGYHMI